MKGTEIFKLYFTKEEQYFFIKNMCYERSVSEVGE